ncbi:DUF4102 domain-containing protein [Stenotrophomonas maltophilia]|nr:DUF4102 domain-containing protein [Stenotrophomonas maltophilia]MBA0366475.1 DUF4102 domain-containing protein [Stenotrophomonas maltophilia]MBA0404136.1 DUF4102 domain-containing protein [Stenotrophomonas maltophilia]MCF3521735.1 integrase arm-type DNA-binding domain-containing protein [Stenotrophomonas maltophilia]
MPKRPELITDKALRAWLRAGPVDRGIGDGLTFVASAHGAAACKASWVLRFRFGGAAKEKVLGRYPDLSLAQAREKARSDRALIQQDIDVAAGKRLAQLDARRTHSVKTAPRPTSAAPNTPLVVQAIDPQRATVCRLVQAWLDRYIPPPPLQAPGPHPSGTGAAPLPHAGHHPRPRRRAAGRGSPAGGHRGARGTHRGQ